MDPLFLIVLILVVLWIGGLSFGAGSIIHLLLFIVLVVIVIRLARGERV